MKYGKKVLKEMTWEQFEDFVRKKGMRAVEKYEEPKAIIAIAETDLEPPDSQHPWGFYQVAYAVGGAASRGNVDMAHWLDFDAMHDSDKGWTQETKRQARIDTAKAHAREFIKKMVEVGRYA